MRDGLRIVIAGGSIGGCAAAAELANAGHRVTVHERSNSPLTSLGIGISTPTAVFDQLVQRNMIDRDVPRVATHAIRYVHRVSTSSGAERRIGNVPYEATSFGWSALHDGIRSQLTDVDYRLGSEVAMTDRGIVRSPGAVEEAADLVVFADGWSSRGRRIVAPGAGVGYQGLILWRGLVPESEVDASNLAGVLTRIVYPGGHGVVYVITGEETAGAHDRRVMWAFYLSVPADDLARVMTDRDGVVHHGLVPLGRTDDDVTAVLRGRLTTALPDYYLNLVDRSHESSIQAVMTVDARRYSRDRLCLTGDAAAAFPPFTGSGVLRATVDASLLRAALDDADDIAGALSARDATMRVAADNYEAFATTTRRMLIDEVPDLPGMTTAAKHEWLSTLHPNAES